MRSELKDNHRHIFSRLLLQELEGVVSRDEQALLFINRRGFSGFVLCRECGYVVRCPSCDVSLTLHLDRERMCCHYCGYEAEVPQSCPDCGGIKIRYFSAGTQRVEDEVKKLYPQLSLIRMDSDTTSSRQAHSRYYKQFRERSATILIGTQMIAKGFDFPDVTLVGVVAADTALNLPDFRAPERTFQLLTQVAGRTARGERGGRVIVQTYHPGHYSILAAAEHDYHTFYEAEIENRRQLEYPPFSDLIRLLFSGSDEKKVFEAASWMTSLLEPVVEGAEILGPAPASLYRIKEMFRVQTVIKGKALTRISPGLKKVIREYHSVKPAWPVRMTVDFNPLVVL
jgi:primosomal protein N' (replication factor Y)